jgi:hypothetical protein
MSALPWFAVWSDFAEHPKTLRLCARLADPNAGMYVIRLLAYCARYAQDGRIPGDMLEHAAGWKRRSSLSQVLLECGFIESEEDRWILHGWAERNGAHVRKHAKDNARPSAPRRNPDKTPRGVSAGSRAGEERRGEEKKEASCAGSASDAPREIPPRVRAFQHALAQALGKTRPMPIAAADRVWSVCDEIDLILASHDSMESVVAACVTHALGAGVAPKSVAWFVQFLRELGPPEGPPEHVAPTPIHLLPAVEFEN